MGSPVKEHGSHRKEQVGGSLAVAGIALAALGIVVSVLLTVATLAATMLVVGLLVGMPAGVLVTPAVRRGLAWLGDYLDR